MCKLVQQAFNCPDTVTPHRSHVKRFVLKKKFNAPVGFMEKLAHHAYA